ncbi:unnamed protein product (macronuclear) [Paramecium tetraurelia]|uniref:HMG box domain-containing protein n=1 Tax=Paramecium tetraurelia TaxID=5888 RepID=A0C1N9_PARTE|nr:uncharacterized protein GSPATT00034183001 [Paramecium tetraurelia]CAK64706.1 unnamed protein product [Paramecium tetraurelia]|eukprot:XP_001432103.1 hypothetical protein (macronuclear) [Paramecium tetraurelia strain d4-2]
MENDLFAPTQYKKELFIFKEFLDGMKELCNKYQQILPHVKQIRKRPKKYKKRNKDPQAPKMPQSAFIFYFKAMRSKFQEENKGKQFQEITSMIAKKWNELSPFEQEPYQKRSEEDRKRYNEEQKQYSVISQQQFSKYLQKKFKGDLRDSDKEDIQPKQEENEDDSFGGNIIQSNF